MGGPSIDDVREHGLEKPPVLSPEPCVVPHPQESSVGLKDVKQGVHGLAGVEILVAQALIGELLPVATLPFDVAAVDRVVGVRLQQVEEPLGEVEALRVLSRSVVLREAKGPKGLSVVMLAVGDRIAAAVHLPVETAVGLVPKDPSEVVVGAASHRKVSLATQVSVGDGVGPKDACAEDRRARHVVSDLEVIGHRPVETAVLLIDGVSDPEGQDVSCQLRLHLPSELALVKCLSRQLCHVLSVSRFPAGNYLPPPGGQA